MKPGETYINKFDRSNVTVIEPYKIKLIKYLRADKWSIEAYYKYIVNCNDKYIQRDNAIMSGKDIHKNFTKV